MAFGFHTLALIQFRRGVCRVLNNDVYSKLMTDPDDAISGDI